MSALHPPAQDAAGGSVHGAAPLGSVGASPVLRGLQIGQHVLFAALLALGAVGAVADSPQPLAVVVLSVLVALWYGGGAALARRRRDRLTGSVWLAVLLLGWLVLVAQSAQFSWVAFPLFFLCLHVLPQRIGLVVVAGLTAVVVASQLATPVGNRVAQVLGPCLGAVVAVGMSSAYRRLLAENVERRRLMTELVAAQADLVATHDALAAAQRESGALAERARLARDIHDTLAQGFSSVLLLARAGLASQGPDPALLQQIEATAADNLEEARRVVHALSPAALDQAPLVGALERLLARTAEQVPVETSLHCDGDAVVLPAAIDVALLRLAQGALANVRQHAKATRVGITVTYGDAEVRLDVVDDGIGFDPAQVTTNAQDGAGFGLRAMRDRLTGLGGTLELESAPGFGTAVAATVPLANGASGRGVS